MVNPFLQKIPKPWGYELIFTPPEAPTVGKLLHINAGSRFSLQYHEMKEETLVLTSGEAKIFYGSDQNNLTEELMKPLFGYFLPKKAVHRIQAITDCDILESSTKEEGTTVRLQDDYQRANETQEDRTRNRKVQSSKCKVQS